MSEVMSTSKKENPIWDEKNSIEQTTKSENNGGLEECDTTIDISDLKGKEPSTDIIRTKKGRKIKNLSGTRFGKLVVISYFGGNLSSRPNSNSMWLCQCDCGNKKVIRRDVLKAGSVKSCGCSHITRGNQNPLWEGHGEISRSMFSQIQWDARDRKIEFNLTIEYLWELYLLQKKKCALTGEDLCFGKYTKDISRTASLDRVDSAKGYIVGNVQWVHKDINLIKGQYSQSYFISLCRRVAHHNH